LTVSNSIRGIKPLGRAFAWHALMRDPKLKCNKGKMRMTVQTRVFTCVYIGTELAPDSRFRYFFGTIMRSSAVATVTSWAFKTILEFVVNRRG